jgi:hypothetical protein
MADPNEAAIAGYLDQVRAAIDEHGWIIQGTVLPSPPETVPTLIAYTVGLTAHDRPELFMMDEPNQWHVAAVLNNVARRHIDTPAGFEHMSRIVVDNQWYTAAEMPPHIVKIMVVARQIYGENIRGLMLISADNFKTARSECE